MTREEQIEKESKNRYPYIKGLPQTSAHQKIFIEAAKWADKTMLEKACEWLKNNLYDTQDNCGYKVVASFDSVDVSEFIEQFKSAMEE